MFKRFFWFIATNIAFMLTISAVLFVINLFFPSLLSGATISNNANLLNIFLYAGVVGFSSALLSLFLSKYIAKWTTGTKIIKEGDIKTEQEDFIYRIIQNQANQLGIKMPEVGVYQDHTPNAFATGYSKNNSLVAFSSGLLNSMSKEEVEAVAAHEMAHINNGDMVTLTLIQGVVNTFVFAISRIITNIAQKSDNEYISNPLFLFIINISLQILLSILTTPIVAYFSRIREFRADYSSAELVGKAKMISALQRLKELSNMSNEGGVLENQKSMSALGITKNGTISNLFSTHPPLDDRINALKNM